MKKNFKALSLFSGAGGMDLGVLQAGFEILASIEKDKYCCATLHAAIERDHRKTLVIENDILQINPNVLMQKLELVPEELDLLFGGPPCQPFSQIGKQRGLDDERGLLLFQLLNFAAVFQPKAVLIEQVKGLVNFKDEYGRKGGVFQLVLKELGDLGYLPKWKILNAADYGLPQLRERVFVVAMRTSNCFEFPLPTHSAIPRTDLFSTLASYKTVGDVISDLDCPAPKGAQRNDSHIDVTPNGDRRRIDGVPEGACLAKQTHLPQEQRKNLTAKDTTKFLRVSMNRPSNTLRGGEIFFHPTRNRYLTPREYMRIHGFPDDYLLQGPIQGRNGQPRYLDQYRQIANAVPPPLARLLAQAIKDCLDVKDF